MTCTKSKPSGSLIPGLGNLCLDCCLKLFGSFGFGNDFATGDPLAPSLPTLFCGDSEW